jgi:hypothetical protein
MEKNIFRESFRCPGRRISNLLNLRENKAEFWKPWFQVKSVTIGSWLAQNIHTLEALEVS